MQNDLEDYVCSREKIFSGLVGKLRNRVGRVIRNLVLPVFTASTIYFSPSANAEEIYSELKKVEMSDINASTFSKSKIKREVEMRVNLTDDQLTLEYHLVEPEEEKGIPLNLTTYFSNTSAGIFVGHPLDIHFENSRQTIFSENSSRKIRTVLDAPTEIGEWEVKMTKKAFDKTMTYFIDVVSGGQGEKSVDKFWKYAEDWRKARGEFWTGEGESGDPDWVVTEFPLYETGRILDPQKIGMIQGVKIESRIRGNGKARGTLLVKLDLAQSNHAGSDYSGSLFVPVKFGETATEKRGSKFSKKSLDWYLLQGEELKILEDLERTFSASGEFLDDSEIEEWTREQIKEFNSRLDVKVKGVISLYKVIPPYDHLNFNSRLLVSVTKCKNKGSLQKIVEKYFTSNGSNPYFFCSNDFKMGLCLDNTFITWNLSRYSKQNNVDTDQHRITIYRMLISYVERIKPSQVAFALDSKLKDTSTEELQRKFRQQIDSLRDRKEIFVGGNKLFLLSGENGIKELAKNVSDLIRLSPQKDKIFFSQYFVDVNGKDVSFSDLPKEEINSRDLYRKVRIIDLEGNLLKTINERELKQDLYCDPYTGWIDNERIFLSGSPDFIFNLSTGNIEKIFDGQTKPKVRRDVGFPICYDN